MTVHIRSYKGMQNVWLVDVRFDLPSGQEVRHRLKSPLTSKTDTRRWAEQKERELYEQHSTQAQVVKLACTLNAFVPRYLSHCELALRQKPAVVKGKFYTLQKWLQPRFGTLSLAALTNARISALKADLAVVGWSAGNNVLRCLSNLLRVAVEFGELEALPCTITTFKRVRKERGFYDAQTVERLLLAADSATQAAFVLLGAHAGLRASEIAGLKWTDVDFASSTLFLKQQLWKGRELTLKSGRGRPVPMTPRLARTLAALARNSEYVVLRPDGRPTTRLVLSTWLKRLERAAGLPVSGLVHVLRHSCVSNLVAAKVAMPVVAKIVGHEDIRTTMGYTHLQAGAVAEAIATLDPTPAPSTENFGTVEAPAEAAE